MCLAARPGQSASSRGTELAEAGLISGLIPVLGWNVRLGDGISRIGPFGWWLIGWAVAWQPVSAAAPAVRLEAPRPYGYRVGDTFTLEARVKADPGYVLEHASLPQPGPINRWLELRRIRQSNEKDGVRLSIEYQTFYAPLTVRVLQVPALILNFRGSTGKVQAEVPSWTFSMSPIHGLAVLEERLAEPVRPDAVPPLPKDLPALFSAALCALAGCGLLAYVAYLRGHLGFVGRGRQFFEAHQVLRALSSNGRDSARLREGFACLHRAFDRTYGEPLFARDLPKFFAAHGHYARLEDEIRQFFLTSYRLFFDGERARSAQSALPSDETATGPDVDSPTDPLAEPPFSIPRLDALCLACLRVERSYG